MTISIWRYSHLTLAVSSFLFIIVASVTGIILAFEPISNQLKPYAISNLEDISISETIESLQKEYDEIISFEVDNHHFVSASVVTKEGNSSTFYINPKTGKKIGNKVEKAPIFKFTTSLHRSLFLKTTGRIFVALVSFLLFLITVSGIVLIVKRQRSFKYFFSKIVKDNFYQYYHIIFGRLSLIPILIITLTGVYLSLEKFSVFKKNKFFHSIDWDTVKSEPKISFAYFPVFKNTSLKEVRYLEFPFSTDVEDYFLIQLTNKEITINQKTGEILSEINYPFTKIISYYSTILHTGQGSILWSVILLLATSSILFFIYSGFAITLKRKKSKIINKFKKDHCEYVILVGSENGSTIRFANLLHQALLKMEKTSFFAELNSFSSYKQMKHLIVITATYGKGDAPTNASKFIKQLQKNKISQSFYYSVVGFGSLAYPHFCKFAYDVDKELKKQQNATQAIKVYTINNQSFEVFSEWVNLWSDYEHIRVSLPEKFLVKKKPKQYAFKVIDKKPICYDETFLIELKADKRLSFYSGDLLAIYPKKDQRERLYSIGKIAKNTLLLSVKRHRKGVVSNLLNNLKIEEKIEANIVKNKDFRFPKKAKQVIFVATGTGIAPFLGMLSENKHSKTYLFWGGRTKDSFSIYHNFINKKLKSKKLTELYLALSREQKKKIYVQHLLKSKAFFISQTLNNKGVIMICGSVSMQKEVTQVLEDICRKNNQKSLSFYQNKGQLKIDCY